MKIKNNQLKGLKMKAFKPLILSGLCGLASLASAAEANLTTNSANSVRVCACRCDSFVALLCPKEPDEKRSCNDFDFEFGGLSEEACKNLTGTACKGYSPHYSGALRGKSVECEIVAREQK